MWTANENELKNRINETQSKLDEWNEKLSNSNEDLNEKREQIALNEEGISRLTEQANILEFKLSAKQLVKRQVDQDHEQILNLLEVKTEHKKKLEAEVAELEIEIPRIEKELQHYIEEFAAIEEEIEGKASYIEELKDSISTTSEESSKVKETIVNKKIELANFSKVVEQEEQNLNHIARENKELSTTLNEVNEKKRELTSELSEIENDLTHQEAVKARLEGEYEESTTILVRATKKVVECEETLAKVNDEVSNLESGIALKRDESKKAQEEIENKKGLIQEYMAKIANLNETLNENILNLQEIVKDEPQLNKKIGEIFAQISLANETATMSNEVASKYLAQVETTEAAQSELLDTQTRDLQKGLERIGNIREQICLIEKETVKKGELLQSVDRRVSKRFEKIRGLESKLINLEAESKQVEIEIADRNEVLATLDEKLNQLIAREDSLLEEFEMQRKVFETEMGLEKQKKEVLDRKTIEVNELKETIGEIETKMKNRENNMEFIERQIGRIDQEISMLEKSRLKMETNLTAMQKIEEQERIGLSEKLGEVEELKRKVSMAENMIEERKNASKLVQVEDLNEMKDRFEKKFFNLNFDIKKTNLFELNESTQSKLEVLEKSIEQFLTNVENEYGYDVQVDSTVELRGKTGSATVSFSGFDKLESTEAKEFFSSVAKELMKNYRSESLKMKFKTKTTIQKTVSSIEVEMTIPWTRVEVLNQPQA